MHKGNPILECLWEAMDDAALVVDASGSIQCYNPVAQRWFGEAALQGHARQWIEGLECRDLAQGALLPLESNPVMQMLNDGRGTDAVLRVVAIGLPWGAKLALQLKPVDSSGRLLVLWRDVTALHGPAGKQ